MILYFNDAVGSTTLDCEASLFRLKQNISWVPATTTDCKSSLFRLKQI